MFTRVVSLFVIGVTIVTFVVVAVRQTGYGAFRALGAPLEWFDPPVFDHIDGRAAACFALVDLLVLTALSLIAWANRRRLSLFNSFIDVVCLLNPPVLFLGYVLARKLVRYDDVAFIDLGKANGLVVATGWAVPLLVIMLTSKLSSRFRLWG